VCARAWVWRAILRGSACQRLEKTGPKRKPLCV
jgi:hypothetical protein